MFRASARWLRYGLCYNMRRDVGTIWLNITANLRDALRIDFGDALSTGTLEPQAAKDWLGAEGRAAGEAPHSP